MKKIINLALIVGVLFFGSYLIQKVAADTGGPVSISATYNSVTGELKASGTYQWEECEPGEETNILGYALFINGGTPANNNSNALEGSGMHLANNGNPCTTTPDSWSDSHILSQAPTSVCMVVYDVRADDSADPNGIHSTIGAGGDYNTDNSWDENDRSYSEGACAEPRIIDEPEVCEGDNENCPTPTPTTSVAPAVTPGPSSDNGSSGGTGGHDVQCNDAKPGIPSLLSVNRNTSTTAILNWSLVPSANNYSIVYGTKSGDYIYGETNVGNVSTRTIGSLNPGSTYYFAVRAVNGCTPGDLSNERSTSSSSGGQVLGASTLANTGTSDEMFMQLVMIFGILLVIRSWHVNYATK